MALEIGSNWEKVADRINTNPHDVEQIRFEIPTTRERAFALLRRWKRRLGADANASDIRSVVLDLKREESRLNGNVEQLFVEEDVAGNSVHWPVS